jgi:hypothetical protein
MAMEMFSLFIAKRKFANKKEEEFSLSPKGLVNGQQKSNKQSNERKMCAC